MKRISNFSNFFSDPNVVSTNEELNQENVRGELIKIVGTGNVNSVDKFMDENNIDVNYDSGMLIRLACKSGNLDLVKYFEEIGGDFSLRKNLSLKISLAHGKTEVAEYILENILELSNDQIEDVEEYLQNSEATISEITAATKLLNKYKK